METGQPIRSHRIQGCHSEKSCTLIGVGVCSVSALIDLVGWGALTPINADYIRDMLPICNTVDGRRLSESCRRSLYCSEYHYCDNHLGSSSPGHQTAMYPTRYSVTLPLIQKNVLILCRLLLKLNQWWENLVGLKKCQKKLMLF